MKVAVIGSRDPVLGFALAGVKEQYQVNSPEETDQAMTRCLQDPDIGIILIEEEMISHLNARIAALQKNRGLYPIVISIPGSE